MNYCPGCQEPLKNEAEQCLYCGYELIGTGKEEAAASSNISPKKAFYKRAIFLVPLIILVIGGLLTGAGFGAYRYFQEKKKSDFEKEIKAVWMEISNRSEFVASNIVMLETPSDLENLKSDLTTFSEFLASKQSQASNIDAPEQYQNNQETLVDAIEKYANYIYVLKLLLQKDPLAVKTSDYTKIKLLADDSEAASQKFVAEAVFVDDNLQAGLFSAVDKIELVIAKIKKQEYTQKQQSLKQQQSVARKAAERTVRSFMQSRIDQSAAEMRRYITPGYDKVFDPAQEFAVTDTYSIDFKITATRAVSEEVFNIRGTETGKDVTGDEFENKWWFKVIKYEGDWLIDNRRLLNK